MNLRVLHLSSEKTWRGGEQQIAYLIEEHKNFGIDCHIFCKKDSAFSRFCIQQDWPFEEAGFNNFLDFISAIKILKYCRDNKIDIVHVHGSRSHGVAVLSCVFGNSSKLVLSRRVDFKLKKNYLSRWKYNHSSIKRILCVSNKIKGIVQKCITRKEICQTIYDGIDINKFAGHQKSSFLRTKYSLIKETLLVGNTSALADHKDYYTFVNTAKEVLKNKLPVCFFIIGTGSLEHEIKDYVKEQGLAEKVIVTGFINNIQEVLPELDVFLMTSKTEGLGTSLLDAMAAGVPIVATDAGGIPEIVINNKTGLTAGVQEFKQLSKQVTRLLQNPDLRNTLIKNSLTFVRGFDKKIMAKKTLQVYSELAQIESNE